MSDMQRRIAMVSIIMEMNDSDEEVENPCPPRGPDREWIRDRPEKGAFANIFKDLELM